MPQEMGIIIMITSTLILKKRGQTISSLESNKTLWSIIIRVIISRCPCIVGILSRDRIILELLMIYAYLFFIKLAFHVLTLEQIIALVVFLCCLRWRVNFSFKYEVDIRIILWLMFHKSVTDHSLIKVALSLSCVDRPKLIDAIVLYLAKQCVHFIALY